MSSKGIENRTKVELIRASYQHGDISLDEAKKLVKPILDDINSKGERIAKEYGKKHKPLTFSYIFR